MDPTTSALLGALIGGLAAGIATVLGTVIASARQETRRLRVELYDRYIPELIHQLSIGDHSTIPEVNGRRWGDLTRLAILAGKRDAKRWEPVDEAARDFHRTPFVRGGFDVKTGEYINTPERQAWVEAAGMLRRELADYFDWLEKRLGKEGLSRAQHRTAVRTGASLGHRPRWKQVLGRRSPRSRHR